MPQPVEVPAAPAGPGRPILQVSLRGRVRAYGIRNQESTVWPDHRDSERKDPVQGDASRRGLEQNDQSSVLEHDDVSHLEEYQEYTIRYLRIVCGLFCVRWVLLGGVT